MGRSSCLNSSRSDEMKFATFRKQPLPASGDGHLEKTSEKTGWKRFFSPAFTFSDYLQVQRERERISCFSLWNTSMMTLQTIPGVRGRITSNFGCWIQNELFSPLLFARRPGVVHCADVDGSCFLGHPAADLIANLCEESRSLLCCVMHLGKRKCFVPPPQKRSEKRRKNTPSITMRLGAHRSSLNYTLYNEYGGVCLFVCFYLI